MESAMAERRAVAELPAVAKHRDFEHIGTKYGPMRMKFGEVHIRDEKLTQCKFDAKGAKGKCI